MRYRVDWQMKGFRIIDTEDGGIVYSELLGVRATELLCEKMNELAQYKDANKAESAPIPARE